MIFLSFLAYFLYSVLFIYGGHLLRAHQSPSPMSSLIFFFFFFFFSASFSLHPTLPSSLPYYYFLSLPFVIYYILQD